MKLPLFSDRNRQARAYNVVAAAEILVAFRRTLLFCVECALSVQGPEGVDVHLVREGGETYSIATHALCGTQLVVPEEVIV